MRSPSGFSARHTVAFLAAVALGLTGALVWRARVALQTAPPTEAPSVADSVARIASDSVSRARQDSINRAQPGYIVDSILPIEEELRRFRARFPRAITRLQSGATSRDGLVRQFGDALAHGDTAALRRLALSEAEFGYLLYPFSPHVSGPLRQAPGLVWMQISSRSEAGLGRLLDRMRSETIRGYSCATAPERQGPNTLWTGCRLRVAGADGVESWRVLFGTIIERGGAFKFVSFANDF